MKRILSVIIIVVILTGTLTGCWDLKIYEQIGFILQLGLERDEEGNILYTVTLPVATTPGKSESEVYQTTTNLIRQGRQRIRLSSGKLAEGGKTQQILFSEELAAEGIHEYLEVFQRSTENPVLAHVAVVEGSPSSMLKAAHGFKEKPRPAFYINQLLTNAYKNAYAPETRIYRFNVDYYAVGIDPVTARLRLTGQGIEVCGSALFSEDQMVGKLDIQQTSLLLAMMDSVKRFEYSNDSMGLSGLLASPKGGTALSLNPKNRKIDISFKNNLPVVKIKIDLQADVSEFKFNSGLNKKDIEQHFENEIAKTLQKECDDVLRYAQSVGSDPVGIGEIIRSKYNYLWKARDWKETYRDIAISSEVKLDVNHYGATY